MAGKWLGISPRVLAVVGVGAALLLAHGARAQTPADVGQWSPQETWPIATTHTSVLPTGKVMFFGEFDQGLLPPELWDPATGQLSQLPQADYNIFCAGHSFLSDGRLLVTGGHVQSHVGEPHARLFDPFTNTWSHVPDMNDNRWYPTNTTLPNGDVVVLAGEMRDSGDNNPLPQVYQADSNTWRDLTGALRDLPYYPRTFVAPNGKVFCAGPKATSLYLDTDKTGTWWEVAETAFDDSRTYGPAVYIDGKVYLMGGGDPPTSMVEVIDLNAPVPAWKTLAPMSVPRRQHNAVLMPDGQILVVGGSSGSGFDDSTSPVFHGELYNPATNTWTRLASASGYHGYHSSAVLVPDGRVLLGGGRNLRTAQVFSPPYLFKGPRPTVTSAPTEVVPGTTFTVATPDAASITKVTLIALNSVTHSFDENQRLLTLPFSVSGGGLTLTAPANNNLAPPGYYQLFLVNAQGVPSVGRIVHVSVVAPKMKKLIALADVWKYDDSGVDRGTAWLDAAYDDSAWKSGPAQLGYGDDDEATVLTRMSPVQPTVYFRKKITLDKPVVAANLEALYDDGLQVWVNGVPVFSRNMDNGLGYAAYASGSENNAYTRVPLPLTPNPFVIGDNLVTAEVKQVNNSSSDLTFALGLEVETSNLPPQETLTMTTPNGGETLIVGSNTVLRWTASNTITAVDLAWSADNGTTWTPIASGVTNGSYTWTVPNVATKQALVRATKAGAASPSDVSDAPFSIATETRTQVIAFGSVWKYEDSGTNPGAAWNTLGFDDSAWKSGPGQLGYGDKDEATVLLKTTPSQTSVYFRKKLTLSGPVTYAQLTALYDDGVAVFVNGTLVFSRNMDSGLAHDKYATASEENAVDSAVLSLSPNPFVVGDNIIGVMVKQVGATSPDLSFDLALDLGITTTVKQASQPKPKPVHRVQPAVIRK